MSQFSEVISGFVQSKFSKAYVGYVAEPTAVFAAIFGMNDFLEKNFTQVASAYMDREAVEDYYLIFLPNEYIAFPDEVLIIHELILDFYQYLFKKKIISRKNYFDMLEFFQNRKAEFLEKMIDDKYWSQEKKDMFYMIIELANGELLADDPSLYDTNIKQLQRELNKFNKTYHQHNRTKIIQFPGGKKMVKTSETIFAYQLRVDLKGFKPPVWRRIIVPCTLTFSKLHVIIQKLFEWKNSPLYLFLTSDEAIQPSSSLSEPVLSPPKNPETTYIKDVFPNHHVIDYSQGNCQSKQHKIQLEKTYPAGELPERFDQLTMKDLPICIKGKGNVIEEAAGSSLDLEKINRMLHTAGNAAN